MFHLTSVAVGHRIPNMPSDNLLKPHDYSRFTCSIGSVASPHIRWVFRSRYHLWVVCGAVLAFNLGRQFTIDIVIDDGYALHEEAVARRVAQPPAIANLLRVEMRLGPGRTRNARRATVPVELLML